MSTTTPGDATLDSHDRYPYSPITASASVGGSATWPNGARLAVYVAIGVEDYHFGEGQTENLLEGVPAPDLVNASWRDYGNRVGAFRLLDRLDSLGIPATILLNTAVYDTAPALLDRARALGAEIVGHGVSNSDSLQGLAESDESAYLATVADRIRSEEGAAPLGWSSPWLTHTDSTVDLLGETGYRYLLDLRLDDRPVWLTTRSEPLLAIPYALELNDSTSIIGRGAGAAEFAGMIVDEFDELLAASSDEPLVMSIVVHSFISGVPFRLRQLTRALEHIVSHRPDVWLAQPRDIHAAVLARESSRPAESAEEAARVQL
jgi:peptidoglycan/xylan/chitin deacetylase (PgdA/CDA1 family)